MESLKMTSNVPVLMARVNFKLTPNNIWSIHQIEKYMFHTKNRAIMLITQTHPLSKFPSSIWMSTLRWSPGVTASSNFCLCKHWEQIRVIYEYAFKISKQRPPKMHKFFCIPWNHVARLFSCLWNIEKCKKIVCLKFHTINDI